MHEAVAKPRRSSVGDPCQANPFPMLTPTYRQDTADWLLTDNVSSWPGTPADRGWRYLKLALERHDGPDTDYRYNKAVLEAILSHDRALPPPPWLIQTLEVSLPRHSVPGRLRSLPPPSPLSHSQDHHHEYLIRTNLRFDILEGALEHTLSLVRKVGQGFKFRHDKPLNP